MGIIRAILFFPFKLIDEGLDFLVFRVLFHRRLWIVNVPLLIIGIVCGYRAWNANHPAKVPSPTASVASLAPQPASVSPFGATETSPRNPTSSSDPTAPGIGNGSSGPTAPGIGDGSSGPTAPGIGDGSPDPTAAGIGDGSPGPTAAGSASPSAAPELSESPDASGSPATALLASPSSGPASPEGSALLPDTPSTPEPGVETKVTEERGTGQTTGNTESETIPHLTPAEIESLAWLDQATGAALARIKEMETTPPPSTHSRRFGGDDPLDLLMALYRTHRRFILDGFTRAFPEAGWRWGLVAVITNSRGALEDFGSLSDMPDLGDLAPFLAREEVDALVKSLLLHAPDALAVKCLTELAERPEGIGTPDATRILTRLNQWRKSVSVAAIPALERIREPSLVPVMEAMMKRHRGVLQSVLARALATSGGSVPEEWTEAALATGDNDIRSQAIHAMAGSPVLAMQLARMHEVSQESDHRVRHAACRILIQAGDAMGLELIDRDLKSPVRSVRDSAIATLELLGERYQTDAVRNLLKRTGMTRELKLDLIAILARSGHPATLTTIVTLIKHKDVEVRRTVLENLSESSYPDLKEILSDRVKQEEDPAITEILCLRFGRDIEGSMDWMQSRLQDRAGHLADVMRLFTNDFSSQGDAERIIVADSEPRPMWAWAMEVPRRLAPLRHEKLEAAIRASRDRLGFEIMKTPWYPAEPSVSPIIEGDLGSGLDSDFDDLGGLGLGAHLNDPGHVQ